MNTTLCPKCNTQYLKTHSCPGCKIVELLSSTAFCLCVNEYKGTGWRSILEKLASTSKGRRVFIHLQQATILKFVTDHGPKFTAAYHATCSCN